MHFDVAVVGVRLAGQQGFQLAVPGSSLERAQRLLGLGDDFRFPFGLAEREQFDGVGKLALERLDCLDIVGEPRAFAHQGLRVFGVVPEIGAFGACVQCLETARRGIVVKDAPSAVPATA